MNAREVMENIKVATTFSKRPGNEGQSLANSKGVYRPVAEILTPVVNHLEALETLLKDLGDIETAHFGSEHPAVRAIKYAISTYQANVEPVLSAANAAKSASLRK